MVLAAAAGKDNRLAVDKDSIPPEREVANIPSHMAAEAREAWNTWQRAQIVEEALLIDLPSVFQIHGDGYICVYQIRSQHTIVLLV